MEILKIYPTRLSFCLCLLSSWLHCTAEKRIDLRKALLLSSIHIAMIKKQSEGVRFC